jgi:replicative superfamily II helicase
VKLVVVDEVRFASDESRGYLVESLVVKALLCHARVVLLSASLRQEDVLRLARWIDGVAYSTGTRPAPLVQHVISKDRPGRPDTVKRLEGDAIRPLSRSPRADCVDVLVEELVLHTLRCTDSRVLIFVGTRRAATTLATSLADAAERERLPRLASREVTDRLRMKLDGVMSSDALRICTRHGIFFHTAQLSSAP